MEIRIIGDRHENTQMARWSISIDDQIAFLTGNSFLLLFSLAIMANSTTVTWKQFVYRDHLLYPNHARFMYRLKDEIKKETGIDFSQAIMNNRSGYYRLAVDKLEIDKKAYNFPDYRIQEIIKMAKENLETADA